MEWNVNRLKSYQQSDAPALRRCRVDVDEGQKKDRFHAWRTHLSVSLDLRVDKRAENVGRDGKVGEDELRLLVKAEQGEVVTQLHGLDGVLLLDSGRKNNNK